MDERKGMGAKGQGFDDLREDGFEELNATIGAIVAYNRSLIDQRQPGCAAPPLCPGRTAYSSRSEEHTSELQSQ